LDVQTLAVGVLVGFITGVLVTIFGIEYRLRRERSIQTQDTKRNFHGEVKGKLRNYVTYWVDHYKKGSALAVDQRRLRADFRILGDQLVNLASKAPPQVSGDMIDKIRGVGVRIRQLGERIRFLGDKTFDEEGDAILQTVNDLINEMP